MQALMDLSAILSKKLSERERDIIVLRCLGFYLPAILSQRAKNMIASGTRYRLSARFSKAPPQDGDAITALSLEELGILYEITRERVRQIQQVALTKLRRPQTLREISNVCRNTSLRPFVDLLKHPEWKYRRPSAA